MLWAGSGRGERAPSVFILPPSPARRTLGPTMGHEQPWQGLAVGLGRGDRCGRSGARSCQRSNMAAAGRTRMMTPGYAAHSRLRRGEANLGELSVRPAQRGARKPAKPLAPRPGCSGSRPRSHSQASLGITGTSAARPGVRENPTTRSGSMNWDGLLPTRRCVRVSWGEIGERPLRWSVVAGYTSG